MDFGTSVAVSLSAVGSAGGEPLSMYNCSKGTTEEEVSLMRDKGRPHLETFFYGLGLMKE